MVNSDGANSKRKRQRQTTSSLAGRQLLPVIVETPAGSILFFSADARWIWHLESGRNVDQTNAIYGRHDANIYQRLADQISGACCEISNTTASNRLTRRRQSEVTTYRAKHLTSISTIAYHSHFYSHPSSPLTMSGWVKNWSTTSRFLEKHEAPSMAREAEGLQSVEDVVHVTHERVTQ